jgi:hypothetical protein
MGREVRRVPLDFDHPLNEVWPGFLRESREFPPCTDCCWGRNETLMDRLFPTSKPGAPTGMTREAYAIDSTFYPHQIGGPMAEALAWCDKIGQAEVDMLVAERRIGFHTHWDRIELPEPWEMDTGHPIRYRFERNDRPAPTAAEVNAANGRGGGPFQDGHHDAISRWLLVKHRCALLGIETTCPTCKGRECIAAEEEWDAEEAASEAWKPIDPPEGDGWQLWETVSEGSPISPVLDSAEALAQWMTENKCTVDGPMRSYEAALAFVRAGWAPSFMATSEHGVEDGTSFIARTSLDGDLR